MVPSRRFPADSYWAEGASRLPDCLTAVSSRSQPPGGLAALANGMQISAHLGCGYGLAGTNGQATLGVAVRCLLQRRGIRCYR
jgi:hypothetical protein